MALTGNYDWRPTDHQSQISQSHDQRSGKSHFPPKYLVPISGAVHIIGNHFWGKSPLFPLCFSSSLFLLSLPSFFFLFLFPLSPLFLFLFPLSSFSPFPLSLSYSYFLFLFPILISSFSFLFLFPLSLSSFSFLFLFPLSLSYSYSLFLFPLSLSSFSFIENELVALLFFMSFSPESKISQRFVLVFLSPSLLVKRTGFLPQEPNLRHSSRMSKNTIRRGP